MTEKKRHNQKQYRQKWRRIDYYPSPEALAAIERHAGLDKVIQGRIDRLVIAGCMVISGKG